jgi:hypothetical protein
MASDDTPRWSKRIVTTLLAAAAVAALTRVYQELCPLA